MKKGLEAPPVIVGTRVAVCKIDTSKIKMSAAVVKTRFQVLQDITTSPLTKMICVWQVYSAGEGMKIKNLEWKQDVHGLERVGDWSQEVKGARQKKCKADSKSCESDLTSAYSCLEPACVLTFSTLDEADEHVDTGHHIMLPENECVYDTIRRQLAATATSIKGKKMYT